jgi:Circadian oscillating protein COP23
MKDRSKSSTIFLVGLAVMLQSLYPISSSHALAGSSKRFTCEINSQGKPEGRMLLPDRKTKQSIISFTDEYFAKAGYTPLLRCQQILERMNFAVESAAERKKLRDLIIVSSKLNGQNVLCFSDTRNGYCRILFLTLTPDRKAKEEVKLIAKAFDSNESIDIYSQDVCKTADCRNISSIKLKLYPFLKRYGFID